MNELAIQIRDALATNPTLTRAQLSEMLEEDISDITVVLDEFLVTEDGVERIGPGQGGNWIQAEEMTVESQHIGYRWPDESIRGEQPPGPDE